MSDQPQLNHGPFYIVDLRNEFQRHKYVTFWRAHNGNYAFPLPWAGQYTQARIEQYLDYYIQRSGRLLKRFPVSCLIVDQLAFDRPDPGDIDGDVGPVLRNTANVRSMLRKAAYLPPNAVTRDAGTEA